MKPKLLNKAENIKNLTNFLNFSQRLFLTINMAHMNDHSHERRTT